MFADCVDDGVDYSDGINGDPHRIYSFCYELQKFVFFRDDNDEQAGLLEQLTSQVSDNVNKYMNDGKLVPYLPELVKDILTLLETTGNKTKYENIVGHAIEFLALIAEQFRHKALFEDPDMMNDICQKVIIPNIEFREFDEFYFERFAEGYMSRDIEGSDVVTPRRSVFNLVRALTFHFQLKMTTLFGQYIKEMSEKYSGNPQGEWKCKVAVIFLFTALNGKKCQPQMEGVTNDLMSIKDFYKTQILPELNNPDVNRLPVLKAEAIKYVMSFRSQLPISTVKESLPLLGKLLTSSSTVVSSYAASAIEKIILIENADKTLVKSTDLSPAGSQILFTSLFGMLAKPAAKENEYIMKIIMRSLMTLQEEILPIRDDILANLIEIIGSVHNPIKSAFNHFLFESLCLYIRIIGRSSPAGSVEKCEADLLPLFQSMLQYGVSDSIPYIFQALGLMLDFHSAVTEPYIDLFHWLTTSADSALWEKSANIIPLVRLLQAFIEKFPDQVAASNILDTLMGVFQKLIASKLNDHKGFILLQSLIENMPASEMLHHLKPVLMILLERLTSLKRGPRHIGHRNKFVKCLLVYFGSFISKHGAVNFIETIDSIEPSRMAKVLDRIMIANLQKVSGTVNKRICAVGATKLICDAPEYLINGPYADYWAPLLQALVQLFEPPENQSGYADDYQSGSDNDQSGSGDDERGTDDYQSESDGYQSGSEDEHFAELKELPPGQYYKWPSYFQLSFGRKTATDTLKDTVPDVKMFLVQNLGKLSAANPGKLHPLITTIAPQAPYTKAQSLLFEYLAAANIQPA